MNEVRPLRAAIPSSIELTGTWRTFRPVIDLVKCTRCNVCWKFCPEPSIDIVDEWPVVDYDYCKGCGICSQVCPANPKAIEMKKE